MRKQKNTEKRLDEVWEVIPIRELKRELKAKIKYFFLLFRPSILMF